MSFEPVFLGGCRLSTMPLDLADCKNELSPDHPKIWLEFRTFDDGDSAGTFSKRDGDQHFPQFSLLPPELRIKIWSNLVTPRIVVACCLYNDGTFARRRRELDGRAQGDRTPVLLRINREARAVGLEHYEQTFGTNEAELAPWRPDPAYLPPAKPPTTWFNFSLDTLWLTGEVNMNDLETPADWSYWYGLPILRFLKLEDTSRVRNIACAVSELGWPRDGTPQIVSRLWSVFRRFPLAQHVPLTIGSTDDERIEGARKRQLTDVWDNSRNPSEMDTVWNGWLKGTTVMASFGDGRTVLLVREDDLAEFQARR